MSDLGVRHSEMLEQKETFDALLPTNDEIGVLITHDSPYQSQRNHKTLSDSFMILQTNHPA